ncbi:MAG: hypothetical protein JW818_22800 [Pirellulales bacterium]|nr:hypothetical protein [Pirellulales bacterium]
MQIERLLESQRDDARLRDHLEGLRHDESLPGLTWFWGPALYERNRVMFRPFILEHFATWANNGQRVERVRWADHASHLDAWLVAARTNRDTQLVRRLLQWQLAGERWGADNDACCVAVVSAYRAATGPAARAAVLEEFDFSFSLDELAALEIYRIDQSAAPFILHHLRSDYWDDSKRTLWTNLLAVADEAGDESLRWSLYRKQVSVKQWQDEVLTLAQRVHDPEQLHDELVLRHPEGWNLDLSDGAIRLLEARGRDVMPYVRAKLESLMGGWYSRQAERFVKLGKSKGWWDLWSAAIRTAGGQKLFNDAVRELLGAPSIDEADRVSRLHALAGVSREWNWPGFGLAVVHSLDDDLAVGLYRRYPEMIHGPYRAHVLPRWWQGGPKLLAEALKSNDEELVDLLASRYATQVRWDYAWGAKGRNEIMETADHLGDYYQAIRDRDPALFARRAAEVLTRIPAYSIFSYSRLLQTNKLARLLFVRSFDVFLEVPAALGDLVEGSDIHVQMLAYNILAQDDPRARTLAVRWLDILIGTLLRPLHRKTRLAAFRALAGAARSDANAAAFILRRAREALHLPDKKYPKEELVGLIGQVLYHRPGLRSDCEQPRVYRREVVTS